ncbi:type II toxin-antitoxin system antitoxin SocA domain-containing protein [Sphingobacterium sp. BIGb0165]|uniref:type II toxin-antitoxin system antitoxin SocA domain-containing protein n=1 Tax=Sphingobacterium sp. BIGb0165 TaxID=2940615 RepID=UPI00216A529C|nr:type II toxin-antitoxin system antitoxin SocA domain-containing protein [Sphingobacterium sp. BIGb0165]MCS4228905.1 putative phage-associated protein [Sphingobacterium sp. BIGb0165]
MSDIKLKYFEYFLIHALSKFGRQKNDFSVLKTQKLLFFAVAAQSNIPSDFVLGESLFNDFKAYQYGPVEHTVYSTLKSRNNTLTFVKIDNRETSYLAINSLDSMKSELAKELDSRVLRSIEFALDSLIRINNNIINYSAFNLVELSHRWKCWSNNYSSFNTEIPYSEIKGDNQYYFI